MLRPDLFELITSARSIGVPVSITPSATPSVTRKAVRRFKELGVAALGISLDAPTAELHDSFRGVDGTFARSLEILAWAREFRLPVQVNTTVTLGTLPHLAELYRLLRDRAVPPVRRWSLFLLVPVGRGAHLGVPSAEEVEALWAWVYEIAREAPFHVGTVEAPHYRRYWIERRLAEGATLAELERTARSAGLGIRDGNGVVFVSHRGEVYPAGFLPYPVGNVRKRPLSAIYRDSPALVALRDMNRLEGKCGTCPYRWACGGSRARAFAMTGDLFGSDPLCAYQPDIAPLSSATDPQTPNAVPADC
jgi:radical SAM protein with 4Fe4S-binding SPASM domain